MYFVLILEQIELLLQERLVVVGISEEAAVGISPQARRAFGAFSSHRQIQT